MHPPTQFGSNALQGSVIRQVEIHPAAVLADEHHVVGGARLQHRVRARRFEEALALFRSEILTAPRVEQGEGGVGRGPEKLHYLTSNDQRRERPRPSAGLERAIPARPWLRGAPKCDTM